MCSSDLGLTSTLSISESECLCPAGGAGGASLWRVLEVPPPCCQGVSAVVGPLSPRRPLSPLLLPQEDTWPFTGGAGLAPSSWQLPQVWG